MKQALFISIATLIVCAITMSSGIIHGKLTNRWGAPPAMVTAAEKLKGVPTRFGDWQMLEEGEMDETSINQLELEAYVKRRYENQKTGQVVNVAVLLGPAGRISVHTPEICMSSRDYKQQKKRERTPITNEVVEGEAMGNLDNFWRLTFKSKGLSRHLLSVYYGWSRGDSWSAFDDPRWECAGSPYLYKIQLAAQVPPGQTMDEADAGKEFLIDFLPVLQPHLEIP